MTSTIALLPEELKRARYEVNLFFDNALIIPSDSRRSLFQAMRYAVIGGGKRLRPILLCATANLFGVERSTAMRAGCAVEALHAYSLIHDDLPAMDDDAMRHGKPSLHLAFDEATAILAGDALQSLAYEILSAPETSSDPFIRANMVFALARAGGADGMVGGQAMDMAGEDSENDPVMGVGTNRGPSGAKKGSKNGDLYGRGGEETAGNSNDDMSGGGAQFKNMSLGGAPAADQAGNQRPSQGASPAEKPSSIGSIHGGANGAQTQIQATSRMQQLKTGALLSAAVEMGAILGRLPPEGRAHLRAYARNIGLGFQITDDLLDHLGDEETVGKALRKDAGKGKQTFVSILGVDGARERAKVLSDQAIEHLAQYGEEAQILREVAHYIVERDR